MKPARGLLVILTLVISLVAGGCWDARSVEDSAFVSLMAVDAGDQPGLELSYDITVPRLVEGLAGTVGGDGGRLTERPGFTAVGRGETMQLAMRAAQENVPRDLRFVHLRGLILGEGFAAAGTGLEQVLDWVTRHPEVRLDVNVFVATGPGRRLLLAAVPSLEPVLGVELDRLLDLQRLGGGRTTRVTLRDFASAHYSPFRDPFAPVIALTDPATGMPIRDGGRDAGDGLKTLRVRGLALFRGNRLAAVLDDVEARGAVWVLGRILGDVSVRAPNGDTNADLAAVTVQRVRTELASRLVDGGLEVEVRTQVTAMLLEQDQPAPVTPEVAVAQLERRLAAAMEAEIAAAMEAVQRVGADPFGFAKRLYEADPAAWHRVRDDWHRLYQDARVEIRVEADLSFVGLAR